MDVRIQYNIIIAFRKTKIERTKLKKVPKIIAFLFFILLRECDTLL